MINLMFAAVTQVNEFKQLFTGGGEVGGRYKQNDTNILHVHVYICMMDCFKRSCQNETGTGFLDAYDA